MCLPVGRAGGVEQARLHEQHERALGMLAAATAACSEAAISLERAAEVHGARASAPPARVQGIGAVERPVELEDARPVAVAPEPARVARPAARSPASRSSCRGVTSSSVGPAASAARRATRPICPVSISPPSERRCGGERVGQALRAAARHGPADGVRAHRQHDAEGGAGGRCAATASSARSSRPAARARARPRSASAPSPPRSGARWRRSAPAASGWRGGRSGPRISLISASALRDERLEQPPVGLARRGRGRPRSAPPSARASRPSRRRAGAPAAPRGGPARGRARRAAGCSGTARRAPARGPWSRCRARSPEASAPRSGSRRRSVSAPSSTVTRRPARASTIAAARPFGPEPTTTASVAGSGNRAVAPEHALQRASGSARACRASSGWRSCATRCASATTGVACRRTRPGCPRRPSWSKWAASAVSVCCQKRSSCLWPPMRQPELEDRVAGAHQHLGLGDRVVVDLGRAEGDPAGEHVALRRHQRERLLVRVEHHHPGGELHLPGQGHVEQRDVARARSR